MALRDWTLRRLVGFLAGSWEELTQPRQPPSWLIALLCLPVGLYLASQLASELYHSYVRQVYVGPRHPLRTLGGAAFSLGLMGLGSLSLLGALRRRPLAAASGRILRAATSTAVAGFVLIIVAAMFSYEGTKVDSLTRPIVGGLRVIADAESLFYAVHGTYTSNLAALDSLQPWHGRGHSTVTVTTADSAGWSANAWSEVITRTCWMSVRRLPGHKVSKEGPWCTKQGEFKPR